MEIQNSNPLERIQGVWFEANGRPKKLWLKELAPRAYELMSARELPEACKGALVARGGARSPLKNAGLKSLRDALAQVPDPRHPKSRRHPLPAMLALIALGLLMGARDVLDIWRKVARLSQSQREAIGLRVRDKQATVRVILEKGGDCLIGTKENTSKRLERKERTANARKPHPRLPLQLAEGRKIPFHPGRSRTLEH